MHPLRPLQAQILAHFLTSRPPLFIPADGPRRKSTRQSGIGSATSRIAEFLGNLAGTALLIAANSSSSMAPHRLWPQKLLTFSLSFPARLQRARGIMVSWPPNE